MCVRVWSLDTGKKEDQTGEGCRLIKKIVRGGVGMEAWYGVWWGGGGGGD